MGGCGPIGVAVASSIEVWSSNPVIGTIFDSYTKVLKWQNWLNYNSRKIIGSGGPRIP